MSRLNLIASLATFVFGVSLFAATAQADTLTVIKVEETWELVVSNPDGNSSGPQVVCFFSPTGNLGCHYATIGLNQTTTPDFSPGGIQLKTWAGESPMDSDTANEQVVLATPNEVIRWTQVMQLNNGQIAYDVTNATSATWGDFGGGLSLSHSTGVQSLDSYSPLNSVAHSGVSFGSQRVSSLKITKVRYTLSNGQVVEDNTVRTVQ